MSHATVELHENYPHEKIEQWEHEAVRTEFAGIGFFNEAKSDVDRRLPRACYFSSVNAVQVKAVNRVWLALEKRLGRKVSIEASFGPSHGFGLRPVASSPAPVAPPVSSALSYAVIAALSTPSFPKLESPFYTVPKGLLGKI